MSKDIQELKSKLQREAISDDESLCKADEKLTQILDEADDDNETAVELIRAFAKGNEVQKRKLLSYCIDFKDPTVCLEQVLQGEKICQHAFLKKDELYMLHQFVKRHQSDISFGETVYKIMDKHGMTAPQVYKNALLRRQDFARVTDSRCKKDRKSVV